MLFSFDLKTVKILWDLILTSYNIREKPACLLLYKLIVLKVSFVVHSTINLQKMPLVELSGFCIRLVFAARLAQLGERRPAEREVVSSNPGRTNTQGLKITEEKVLSL